MYNHSKYTPDRDRATIIVNMMFSVLAVIALIIAIIWAAHEHLTTDSRRILNAANEARSEYYRISTRLDSIEQEFAPIETQLDAAEKLIQHDRYRISVFVNGRWVPLYYIREDNQ